MGNSDSRNGVFFCGSRIYRVRGENLGFENLMGKEDFCFSNRSSVDTRYTYIVRGSRESGL